MPAWTTHLSWKCSDKVAGTPTCWAGGQGLDSKAGFKARRSAQPKLSTMKGPEN